MDKVQHYVLFPNHDNGMRLHRELKAEGVRAVIAPTPRSASKCCGISLLIKKDDIETVKRCIEEHGIEILDIVEIKRDIDPNRDKYC
ncbi:DUF3343 domain-containing protein [[Clostridium] hylemonae]|uniref:Putative Se/S carrier protein-like domain-containing protein n=1 Tax=[Clostridium] hylemonae DSM 15053 TaxID=553973 RepID=C0C4K8_9FIRM|nr:DUF3343 domain-containing protein [[Clostridium] hylemonae]EEG73001.1 hypothetical protein CLOHYLEM_07024 [[Clostridium] hylemonae DSM 15053]QEK16254.1 hypothetical protein LAJLEIBI_00234 [[Clostridium] hylemonae DSM 15053]